MEREEEVIDIENVLITFASEMICLIFRLLFGEKESTSSLCHSDIAHSPERVLRRKSSLKRVMFDRQVEDHPFIVDDEDISQRARLSEETRLLISRRREASLRKSVSKFRQSYLENLASSSLAMPSIIATSYDG